MTRWEVDEVEQCAVVALMHLSAAVAHSVLRRGDAEVESALNEARHYLRDCRAIVARWPLPATATRPVRAGKGRR